MGPADSHTGLPRVPRYCESAAGGGGGTPNGAAFQSLPLISSCDAKVLQTLTMPRLRRSGSSPSVARHYWGNHSLFFLRVLRCFQFPAFASRTGGIISLQDIGLSPSGDPRVKGYLRASPRLFPRLIKSFIACKSLKCIRPYALHYFRLYCFLSHPSRQWRDYGKK